ncbi:MAG: hypothetical protein HY079_06950 [Elusimicrobia bacterium]|nr:hypothetical protein [Elusimicrobiota bacterium]
MKVALVTALASACALVRSAPAAAQVSAVLSSDARPYQEAWEGFREAAGPDATRSFAGDGPPPGGARVIVAFGAKAALRSYDGPARVIVAMAPSVAARRSGRADAVRVCMTPDPQALLARMKALQPGLKRLGVVWKSDFYGEEYLPLLRAAGQAAGVKIDSYPLAEEDAIPDQLRGLVGAVDSLWLPPDPLVINERNFLLFRDFALANRIPLYVPVDGLAERGATAAIGVSFRSIGRAAGVAAKKLLAGEEPGTLVFPSPVESALNLKAAAAAGLVPPPEALGTTKVLP